MEVFAARVVRKLDETKLLSKPHHSTAKVMLLGRSFRGESLDVVQSLSAKVAAALGSAGAVAIKVKLVRETSFSATYLFL